MVFYQLHTSQNRWFLKYTWTIAVFISSCHFTVKNLNHMPRWWCWEPTSGPIKSQQVVPLVISQVSGVCSQRQEFPFTRTIIATGTLKASAEYILLCWADYAKEETLVTELFAATCRVRWDWNQGIKGYRMQYGLRPLGRTPDKHVLSSHLVH